MAGHRHHIEDPSTMELYVALISRVVLVRVDDNRLLIESWTPVGGRDTQQRQFQGARPSTVTEWICGTGSSAT